MSDQVVQIGKYKIGRDYPPFIVAEMSGNHNQSLERALQIVEAASKTGVQALKLQTYTADTLTLNVRSEDFMLRGEGSLWKDQSLYDLFKTAHTPWEWHAPIMKRAQDLGMLCFSSPFDESAVDFLESLNVPAYKIASMEIVHLPLIRKVASTGKPVIISTGMATAEEIQEAVETARSAGCRSPILLKCTSAYPAMPEDAHLMTIPDMQNRFSCPVGLSDHTLGIEVPLVSVAFGAVFIEKHFTLKRSDGGPDSTFSLEPDELQHLVEGSKKAWQALGKISYGPNKAQELSLQERRSLYVAEDMRSGEVFTRESLRCIRPSYGLAPKYYDSLLGARVTRDVKMGTPVSWDFIEKADKILE
jgi:N-acetylneuraminate synthase